jgi:hypothetical protein
MLIKYLQHYIGPVSSLFRQKIDAFITHWRHCMLFLIPRARRLCPWQVLVLLGCVYCASAYWQRIVHKKKDVIRFSDLPAVSVFTCVSGMCGM